MSTQTVWLITQYAEFCFCHTAVCPDLTKAGVMSVTEYLMKSCL